MTKLPDNKVRTFTCSGDDENVEDKSWKPHEGRFRDGDNLAKEALYDKARTFFTCSDHDRLVGKTYSPDRPIGDGIPVENRLDEDGRAARRKIKPVVETKEKEFEAYEVPNYLKWEMENYMEDLDNEIAAIKRNNPDIKIYSGKIRGIVNALTNRVISEREKYGIELDFIKSLLPDTVLRRYEDYISTKREIKNAAEVTKGLLAMADEELKLQWLNQIKLENNNGYWILFDEIEHDNTFNFLELYISVDRKHIISVETHSKKLLSIDVKMLNGVMVEDTEIEHGLPEKEDPRDYGYDVSTEDILQIASNYIMERNNV